MATVTQRITPTIFGLNQTINAGTTPVLYTVPANSVLRLQVTGDLTAGTTGYGFLLDNVTNTQFLYIKFTTNPGLGAFPIIDASGTTFATFNPYFEFGPGAVIRYDGTNQGVAAFRIRLTGVLYTYS